MEAMERDAHQATLHVETPGIIMRTASPVRTAAYPVLLFARFTLAVVERVGVPAPRDWALECRLNLRSKEHKQWDVIPGDCAT